MIFSHLLQLLLVVLAVLVVLSVTAAYVVVRQHRDPGNTSALPWILAGLVALLAILTGVAFWANQPPNIQGTPIAIATLRQPALQQVITSYLETKVSPGNRGEKAFCAYQLFGGLQRKQGMYVYLWSLCGGFVPKSPNAQSGSSLPVALRIAATPWRVIAHQVPQDGSLYTSSIKRIFPRKYHDLIFGRTLAANRRVRRLQAINHQRAKQFFARHPQPSTQKTTP